MKWRYQETQLGPKVKTLRQNKWLPIKRKKYVNSYKGIEKKSVKNQENAETMESIKNGEERVSERFLCKDRLV